jgi:hypothetical protein
MAVTYIEQDEGRTVIVEVRDRLTRADYEKFVPRVEKQIERHGKINFVARFDKLEGVEPGALWEDLKFDVRHFDDIRRVAIIGDKSWEKWMAKFCRPFTTAEVEYFGTDQAANAIEWASETARV